jgi:ADP-Ribosyltransferase in polyvalent proteins
VIDATMDEHQVAIGEIGRFAVSVEGQPVDRKGRRGLEVTLTAEGQTQGTSIEVAADGTEDSARKAATYAVNAAMSMAKGSSHKARYLTEDMARAKKALAELDQAGTMGDWPGEAKLATARQAHRDVLQRLSAAGAPKDEAQAPTAQEDDAQTPFSRRRRTGAWLGVAMADAKAVVAAVRTASPTAPPIVLHGTISDAPETLQRVIAQAGATDVEAAYHEGAIHVFPNNFANVERMLFVVGHHEIRHHGLRTLLGDRLGPTMLEMYRSNDALRAQAQQKIVEGHANSRVVAVEEALADMPIAQLRALNGWDRIVATVRDWLRRVSAALRRAGLPTMAGAIEPGTWTDDDIAAMVARAEDVSRGKAPTAGGGTAFSRAPGVDSEAFRAWFDGSAVVDAAGKPLVVYHGTAAEKAVFERASAAGPGAYFSPRPDVASQYAQMDRGSPHVMPAYLALKNPKRLPLAESHGFTAEQRDAWEREGFDGVLGVAQSGRVVEYVAFRPNQVKSVFNRGSFDPASNDVRFSRAGDLIDTLRSTATRRGLTDLYQDATTSQRGFNRWWHRTVGTQYHKAQVNPDFKRVFDHAQDYLHDTSAFANDAAAYAPGILPQLKSWRDINKSLKPRDAQALAGPVFEGTLRYERDAAGALQEAGGADRAGVVFTDAELQTLYGLTELQRGLYREFRASVDRSLDLLVATDVAKDIGADLPVPLKQMVSDGDTGRFKGLALAMLQRQVETAEGEGAPMWRALLARVQAKYDKIDALKARGYAPLMRFGQYAVHVVRPDGASEFFGLYESQRQANQAARQFRETFAGEDVDVQQGVMPDQAYKLFSGMSPETLEVFADVAGVERNEAFQAYLKLAASNRSALKRLIHRKGVKGYNEDASRVLAQFITSNARAGAGALHLGDMGLAIGDMQERKVAGDVIDEAIKLREYVQNPVEEAQAIRGLLFAQYLGGSVASAAVNMTQPLTMTFPFLSQFGGAVKAARRLAAGIKTAVSTVDPASDLGRALAKAEKEGIVSPQEIHQLQGEAMRRAGNNEWVKKGLFVWGSLFSLAEQFNRRSTFIAAWNTAREERIADPFAFAADAVDQTQGVYNKANKPNWARGAVGSTIFTFKQYSISYMEFLKRLPAKERALALGVLLLLSGLQGLPGMDDLDDIFDTLAQQLGYDLQSKAEKARFLSAVLGQGGADFVLHGFSALPGFPLDLASRLSVGNLLPGTGIMLKSREDKAREVAEVIGPVASLATDALKAIERRELKLVAPKAIFNAMKGLEMHQTGQYRDTAGRKVRDVDTFDAVVKGVGFQPAEVARDSRAMQTQRQKVQLARTVESEIAGQWATGIVDGEVDKVRAARERLRQWNADNPGSRIAITPPQISRRVNEMRMTRDERAVRAAPKELRAGVREALTQ